MNEKQRALALMATLFPRSTLDLRMRAYEQMMRESRNGRTSVLKWMLDHPTDGFEGPRRGPVSA